MPSEEKIEVHRQLRTTQDKFTYFILAVDAAAVAYVVKLTQNSVITFAMVPLGIAVFLWAVSFLYGCRQLQYVSSTLYANFELIRIQRGEHPEVGTHPDLVAAAAEGIRLAIESNSEKANNLAKKQFGCLIAGAIFFVSWHIIEMVIRTLKM